MRQRRLHRVEHAGHVDREGAAATPPRSSSSKRLKPPMPATLHEHVEPAERRDRARRSPPAPTPCRRRRKAARRPCRRPSRMPASVSCRPSRFDVDGEDLGALLGEAASAVARPMPEPAPVTNTTCAREALRSHQRPRLRYDVVDGRDRREQPQRVLQHRVDVLVGRAGHRLARDHHLVAGVHRLDGEAEDADVHRHAGGDDRPHAEVAQELVELGAVERRDAVEARRRPSRRRAARARATGACCGEPGSSGAPLLRVAASSRQLAAAPPPSGRRAIGAVEDRHARAARAAASTRAICAIVPWRATASAERAELPPPPMMPSWHSIRRSAVRDGSSSAFRSTGTTAQPTA